MGKLDSVQLEQLREIGVHLHQTREQQSKSLEEVAAKTFIPLRLLRAIEVGQATVLPQPIFIQGFIRRYGDLVGLDGTALAKQFSLDSTVLPTGTDRTKSYANLTPQPAVSVPEKFNPKTAYAEANVPETTRTEGVSETTYSEGAYPQSVRSTRAPFRVNPLYAIWALIGAIAIGGVIYVVSQSSPSQSESAQDADLNATNSLTAPSPSAAAPEVSPSAQPQPSAIASPSSSSPIEVSIDLTDASWIRVTADGKVEYEGTLKKGEQRSWTAKEQLVIRAGNAGAVSASFNGAAAKALGEQGSVATVTFP